MLGVTLVAALGDIPNTELYARHQDRAIVVSAILGLVAATALNLILVPQHGVVGAAGATLLACVIMAGVRMWFVRRGRAR
jgi:O-antigen/teichoic acid export membrane protein